SNAGISLSLSPNPIEFDEDNLEQDLELTVTTTGFGSLSLDNMIIKVIDENDDVIFDEEKEIDVSSSVIEGITKTVSYNLDLKDVFDPAEYDDYSSDTDFTEFYNKYLKDQDKEHTLRITVTGSNNTTLTVDIIYK
ncbi:MAG: hypothetical protein ACLFSO_03855, partial [Halanaerobium sp.]